MLLCIRLYALISPVPLCFLSAFDAVSASAVSRPRAFLELFPNHSRRCLDCGLILVCENHGFSTTEWFDELSVSETVGRSPILFQSCSTVFPFLWPASTRGTLFLTPNPPIYGLRIFKVKSPDHKV
ncbi:hypothetical protein B0H13DRAFT_961540 [Mycena leptocephala]|nr:hypothetical protein B0H13DRAFT_961540 [Mycena leptocephala]